jgi:predicted transglutaminase-like cysteine proteinase
VLTGVLCAVPAAWAEGLHMGLTPEVLLQVESEHGAPARDRLEDMLALIRDAAGADERTRIERVNAFFNALPYRADADLWGRDDYWAGPVQMLTASGGDCEDYAIAKYFVLRELGIPVARLRILYVKSLRHRKSHMVLAYYEEGAAAPLLLDSLTDRIQSARERTDLVPAYSFNHDSLWIALPGLEERRVGGAERVGPWLQLRDGGGLKTRS